MNDVIEMEVDFKGEFIGEKTIEEATKGLLDTTQITDYTSFFKNGLRSEIIGKVDTSNALSIESMYHDCYKLEEIPPMNTSKCKNFKTAFMGCDIKTVPDLDTSNGENFISMFSGCGSLETVPDLDTSNGKFLNSMFNMCFLLKTAPNLDTSSAEDMGSMFASCNALSGVITLDTKNCTSLSGAFAGCGNLEEINFTDTSNIVQWGATFQSCYKLHTINNLSVVNGGYSTNMFFNCQMLQNVTFVAVKLTDNNFTLTAAPLTAESLDSLVNALVDNTDGYTRTIRLGTNNIRRLSDSAKQLIYDKNYDFS